MPDKTAQLGARDTGAEPEGRARPRYLEIKAELIGEIRSGAYPIGALLPTEHDLCQRFEVSRFTVRQALKGL